MPATDKCGENCFGSGMVKAPDWDQQVASSTSGRVIMGDRLWADKPPRYGAVLSAVVSYSCEVSTRPEVRCTRCGWARG